MNSLWLLSCVLLASCALGEYIYGPGGRLLSSECHVELPHNATVVGSERIVLADGTVVPYPSCAHHLNNTVDDDRAAPSHNFNDTDRKREADGWNEYLYFYPGYSLDQFNGDWVVPQSPGQFRNQLLYFFTGLEPSSYSPILQPVVWYGISPAGGGNAWFAAVWEVNSNNAYTTSPVVQVYPGQVIHTTMIRYPGSFWNCLMYANGQYITGANFADRDYHIAFTTLEVYNVADCFSLPYLQTTSFFNLQIHQYGGGYVNPTWYPVILQSDCNQGASGAGSSTSLTYGLASLLSPLVFDAAYYKQANPDLPWNDAGNLQNHWLTSGVYEGRIARSGFYVVEYKQIYSDLAPLPNMDAISHYVTNGFFEGRVGRIVLHPLAFNWNYYLNQNSDVVNYYGYDRNGANNHWAASGVFEGRQGISTFHAPTYLALYPDLRAAFGYDYNAATRHWVTSGYYEGRRGV